MASFMSHDAAHGALPTLRAVTATDTASGSCYGPEKMFGLKGDPVSIKLPKPAQNNVEASKLWKISEQLTGAVWPWGELNRPALTQADMMRLTFSCEAFTASARCACGESPSIDREAALARPSAKI
jgi:hypothetical protein